MLEEGGQEQRRQLKPRCRPLTLPLAVGPAASDIGGGNAVNLDDLPPDQREDYLRVCEEQRQDELVRALQESLTRIHFEVDGTELSPVYLGQVEFVEAHRARFHQDQPVVVINAFSAVPHPLGIPTQEQVIALEQGEEGAGFDESGRYYHYDSPNTVKIQRTTADGTKQFIDTVYSAFSTDAIDTDIRKYFDSVADIIHQSIEQRKPVYITCYQGVSRSTSYLMAYFIKYGQHPVVELSPKQDQAIQLAADSKEAVAYLNFQALLMQLRTQRAKIAPNIGFTMQLSNYLQAIKHSRAIVERGFASGPKRPVINIARGQQRGGGAGADSAGIGIGSGSAAAAAGAAQLVGP